MRLPKINTKRPTRTESVEMSKIVTVSEIHLHHCLWESRGFKIGRSSHRRCSIKKLLLKILQNWEENTCVRVRHDKVFSCQFYKIFENTFFNRTLPGNCFWWISLIVKNVNFVTLIFLNSQLYHASPVVMTIILM